MRLPLQAAPKFAGDDVEPIATITAAKVTCTLDVIVTDPTGALEPLRLHAKDEPARARTRSVAVAVECEPGFG